MTPGQTKGEQIQIPPTVFESVITLPSSDFQKICRDMVNISDEIEIKAVDNSLILTCKGEFAEQETVIGECSSNGISSSSEISSPSFGGVSMGL